MSATATSPASIEVPGTIGSLPLVNEPQFWEQTEGNVFPVYRVMDEDGSIREGAQDPGLDKDQVVKMYRTMNTLKAMDNVFYDAQRQGRISFYMTHYGEEGALIGSAAAYSDEDMVFGQYREAGVLMWRGFTLQNFADQCYSNEDDPAKGRQMPVHYGSKAHNFQTISSPLATQLPQAAGAGYAMRAAGEDRMAVCYFGEGAASEGDFHAALNFASTLRCPVLYFCRNNGYAISTPVKDQYAGDGIAARGPGYGMRTVRVDGNDIWAVFNATKAAREYIVETGRPVLLEAMTYRIGHHSTSDDSTRYRTAEEIDHWRQICPIARLRRYMEAKQWWSEAEEAELQATARKEVLKALNTAEKKAKPGIEHLYGDVFANTTEPLRRQESEVMEHLKKHGDKYSFGAH